MANAALQPMRLSYQEGNYSSPVDFSTPEGATQTYIDGALLVASGGAMVECGANPARIDGVAIGAAHNLAAIVTDGLHNAMFVLPHTDSVFEISIDKASAQAGAGAVIAASLVGTTIGVTKDSAGVWYADVDKEGANQKLMIIGFPVWSPPGTVNGRVFVKFLAASVLL